MPELLAILVVFILIGLWVWRTSGPEDRQRLRRYGMVGLLVLVGLVLAARGMALLDLPLGAAVAFLLRHWSAQGFAGADRVREWLSRAGRPDGSTIETAWLRVSRDPTTGVVRGDVRSGQFAGRRLDQLSRDQLRALLSECAASDARSAELVQSYLDHAHPGWRAAAGNAGSTGGSMSRDEAWQVLGLQPGADSERIREAHRLLMIKLHPDRGGSTYLAAKINAARDVLLGDA